MNTVLSSNREKPIRTGGFVLIEAMLAIVIFAIGMLAVLAMQTKSVKANDIARGISEQSDLAVDVAERLMQLPYGDADLSIGDHDGGTAGRYALEWAIAEDDPIDNTKTITVTVTWDEDGFEKTTELVTVKPDRI